MLLNNLEIAWRHLTKQKTLPVINIAGLAVGITCTLLSAFYIKDANSLYHITQQQCFPKIKNVARLQHAYVPNAPGVEKLFKS